MSKHLLLLITLMCAVCSCAGPSTPDEPLPSVNDDGTWRVAPVDVIAPTANAEQMRHLRAGRDLPFTAPSEQSLVAELRVAASDVPIMFTYEPMSNASTTEVFVAPHVDDAVAREWELVEMVTIQHTRPRLRYVELPPAAHDRWVRVTMNAQDVEKTGDVLRLGNVGFYRIDPDGHNDYWIALGASLTGSAIRHRLFQELAFEHFGERPVMFNHGIGGWTSQTLNDRLDDILAKYPRAKYAVIHIGGNDVSRNRPYPGGAETLSENLIDITTRLQARGITPILSRLSFRDYNYAPAVPPESNGSGPYVENVFDPVIQEFTPRFYDTKADRGVVNFYDHYKAHPEELWKDGVHLNEAGKQSMTRLWVIQAGPIVYDQPLRTDAQ